MKIRAIIVDDEPLGREGIRLFLKEEPDVEVVDECGEGATAVESIRQHKPDLIFLDVQMPNLNGFEVLEALASEEIPAVIFTTAHDEHAIRAFEVNALDYLLKPFRQTRFKKALQRARDELQNRPQPGPTTNLANLIASLRGGADGRILIKSPDRILFLKPGEIDHIEAAGNYLVLHAGKERHVTRDTMTAMETRLAPAGFMRIN